MADDDGMNIFDAAPLLSSPTRKRRSEQPPPPASEDDYGATVLPFRKKPAAQWKEAWQQSDNGTPLPNLFNCLIALRCHPRLASVVAVDAMENLEMVERTLPDGTED